MPRPYATWATLAVVILYQADGRADGQQSGPVRQATPVNWHGKFRQASRSLRPTQDFPTEPNESHHLVALTTEAPARLIIQAPHVRPGRPSAEMALWLTDLDGDRPVLLADESGRSFLRTESAPGSGRVAYIAAELARPDDPQPLREATLRVAEPGMPTRTVATGLIQRPRWSPDGRTLFFLQAVAGGWQLFKSEEGGEPVPASATIFNQTSELPARVSPDGLRVVGFRKLDDRAERLVEVDLNSGGVREISGGGSALEIDWSPDSKWIYLRTVDAVRRHRTAVDDVLCLATKRSIPINNRLDLLSQPVMSDRISITAAAWLPGPGHRMLLLAQHQQSGSDLIMKPLHEPREARWLVRDFDEKTSSEVVGLPLPTPWQLHPVDSSRLYVSPDGRHVLGLNVLSVLDRPL